MASTPTPLASPAPENAPAPTVEPVQAVDTVLQEKPMPAPQRKPDEGPAKARYTGGILPGSVSIKVAPVKVEMPKLQADVKPLTQEDLERYWQEAGESLELTEVLKNGTVRLGEKSGTFEVDAQTTWFSDEFKPHRFKVLEYMREKTGMRMLDCRVNPLFVGKDEIIYSPDQKYNALLEANPKLSALRKLFPSIDY